MPNKTANTITVRATAPVVDVIERMIRANDKPRAEVVLDVEILEVESRARSKRYGINLSRLQPGPAVLAGTRAAQHAATTPPTRAAAVQPEHDHARASAPPTSISACRRRW